MVYNDNLTATGPRTDREALTPEVPCRGRDGAQVCELSALQLVDGHIIVPGAFCSLLICDTSILQYIFYMVHALPYQGKHPFGLQGCRIQPERGLASTL
jgi:hypothetical protein